MFQAKADNEILILDDKQQKIEEEIRRLTDKLPDLDDFEEIKKLQKEISKKKEELKEIRESRLNVLKNLR